MNQPSHHTRSTGPSLRNLEVALAVFCSILVFWYLGAYGLVEDSEARYVEITWEMLKSGDWLTPHLNFISHFHKPPLTFWLSGLTMGAFGISEWAARLPVTLASLTTVWLVVRWSRQHGVCSKTHLLTGLILITSVEFWALARSVLTDMYLALSVTAAQYLAWRILNGERGRQIWLFWLALAFSFMVKGPVGPLLVGLTLLGYRLSGGSVPWSEFRPLSGLALSSLLALPWYFWAAFENRGLFEYFLKYQTLDRYLTTTHGRGGPFWYFLPVVLVGMFPWTAALWQGLRRAWERRDPLDRFLLCWVLLPLAFFSFSGSKLPTYILPIIPALAMITGRVLDDPIRSKKAASATALSMMVLACGLCFFLLGHVPGELGGIFALLHLVCGVLAFGAAFTWLAAPRSLPQALVAVGASFGLVLMLLSQAAPRVQDRFSAKTMASQMALFVGPRTVIAEVGTQVYGLPYYLRRRLVHVNYERESQFDAPGEVEGFLWQDLSSFKASMEPDRDYLLVLKAGDYREEEYPGFKLIWRDRWVVLRRRGL